MSPSEAWSEGDARRWGGTYPCARWRLDSGLNNTEPLEKHIEALLTRLDASPAAVRALAPDYKTTIQCVGYYPAKEHGVSISQGAVQVAAHLGLNFDLDFYFFDEREQEESARRKGGKTKRRRPKAGSMKRGSPAKKGKRGPNEPGTAS